MPRSSDGNASGCCKGRPRIRFSARHSVEALYWSVSKNRVELSECSIWICVWMKGTIRNKVNRVAACRQIFKKEEKNKLTKKNCHFICHLYCFYRDREARRDSFWVVFLIPQRKPGGKLEWSGTERLGTNRTGLAPVFRIRNRNLFVRIRIRTH